MWRLPFRGAATKSAIGRRAVSYNGPSESDPNCSDRQAAKGLRQTRPPQVYE